MNLSILKQVISTRARVEDYYVCKNGNNNQYVYVIDGDRRIIFTSTDDAIRFNKALANEENATEVIALLQDVAQRLGRKYLEAEWPEGFLARRQLRDCQGNWNPKVLAPIQLGNQQVSGAPNAQNTIMTDAMQEMARTLNQHIMEEINRPHLTRIEFPERFNFPI